MRGRIAESHDRFVKAAASDQAGRAHEAMRAVTELRVDPSLTICVAPSQSTPGSGWEQLRTALLSKHRSRHSFEGITSNCHTGPAIEVIVTFP